MGFSDLFVQVDPLILLRIYGYASCANAGNRRVGYYKSTVALRDDSRYVDHMGHCPFYDSYHRKRFYKFYRTNKAVLLKHTFVSVFGRIP